MSRALRPGRASMVGLRWLASVGPAPFEAWRIAMGWSASTTFSHAARLARAGWVSTCARPPGHGSLYYATRSGVAVAGVAAAPVTGAPAPTTWAHCEACGWAAAWLAARGRELRGPRELLAGTALTGELEWVDRTGSHRRGHRPDLVGAVTPDGALFPIEVELTAKSANRLRAVLGLHAAWIAAGTSSAVLYICQSTELADRVRRHAAPVGLTEPNGTLRVELLATIRDQARASRSTPNRDAAERPALVGSAT